LISFNLIWGIEARLNGWSAIAGKATFTVPGNGYDDTAGGDTSNLANPAYDLKIL
jgi:hypothetical protein